MKSQLVFKKSFEENSESQENNLKAKNSKKNLKNNNSRVSTKEANSLSISTASLNVAKENIQANPEILDLIESLREKIEIYQQEIGNLLDEKVQMQMMINELQMAKLENKRNLQRNSCANNEESNKNFNGQKNDKCDINKELNVLNNHIVRQKEILEKDYSILNETIGDGVNINIKPKQNFEKDFLNLNLQREAIANEIKELKDELKSLIDLQNNFVNKIENENEINSDNKSDIMNKSVETIQNVSNLTADNLNNNNNNNEETCINLNINANEKINDTSPVYNNNNNLNHNQSEKTLTVTKIPKIEKYFVLNGKISLVDSENNLWHLTKCVKYETEKNKTDIQDKEKFLNEFLVNYQKLSNEKQSKMNSTKTEIKIEEDKCDAKNIYEIEEKNLRKSQFDSNFMNNMTTLCSNKNSEKNYDSVINNEIEIKIDQKNDELLNEEIIDTELDINVDNNESLVLSDSS